ncbi:hypothetical protein ACSQ67_016717 [Phaseolus vulgaris]
MVRNNDILTSPYLCEVLLLADLERYYESSVPDSIVGPSGSPVLQKSLMLKLLLLLMDYLGPRLNAFKLLARSTVPRRHGRECLGSIVAMGRTLINVDETTLEMNELDYERVYIRLPVAREARWVNYMKINGIECQIAIEEEPLIPEQLTVSIVFGEKVAEKRRERTVECIGRTDGEDNGGAWGETVVSGKESGGERNTLEMEKGNGHEKMQSHKHLIAEKSVGSGSLHCGLKAQNLQLGLVEKGVQTVGADLILLESEEVGVVSKNEVEHVSRNKSCSSPGLSESGEGEAVPTSPIEVPTTEALGGTDGVWVAGGGVGLVGEAGQGGAAEVQRSCDVVGTADGVVVGGGDGDGAGAGMGTANGGGFVVGGRVVRMQL